jgi:hypothetical protein
LPTGRPGHKPPWTEENLSSFSAFKNLHSQKDISCMPLVSNIPQLETVLLGAPPDASGSQWFSYLFFTEVEGRTCDVLYARKC